MGVALPELVRNSLDLRVVQKGWLALLRPRTLRTAKRAVCCENDVVLPAMLQQLLLLKIRVALHLVHCRRNACEAHHLINLFAVEVGDADRLHQPFINKLFHFTPRLFKRNVSVLHGAVLILWHVRLLRVEHERHRPVDQIQIQVLQLQRLETLHKGRLDRLRAVPGVPELARHEHLLSLDAGGECGLQAISHLGLIQVDECGIHVPVSHLQSVLHSSLHLTRLGLPSPQTQQRHLGSGVQSRAHCGGHGLDRKWADSNSQFT
mmetsp:Transcript_26124/g.67354  ORF Transcript_26124/g.67354 Transcript_26124/m.67354 type:complete len:263 (-) Transcript_26124:22-810(-)